MEAFNIKDIKVVPKKGEEPELEELMTDSIVKGLSPNSPVTPNAELEKNEYVLFPGQHPQKIVGDTHEKGGVKMSIPDGTLVISDNLKPNASQVKLLTKEYGLDNISVKNTYAEIMDKYQKKIGLNKLNGQQEDLFEQVRMQKESKIDEKTLTVNLDFVTKKIANIETQKESLNQESTTFFNTLFDMQEMSKPKDQQATREFADGGMQGALPMSDFDTKQEYVDYMNQIGYDPKTAADKWDIASGKAPSTDRTKASSEPWGGLSGQELEATKRKWNNNEQAYLNFKQTRDAIANNPKFQDDLYAEYKKTIQDPQNYTSGKKSNWYSALQGRTKDEVITELLAQEERNARISSLGLDVKNTSQSAVKGIGTNKEILDLKNQNPDVLGDLSFEKGYLGQAAYIAYDQLMNKPDYKGFRIEQTGRGDEPIRGTISGIDNASTNTTAGQRLNFNIQPAKPAESPIIPAEQQAPTKTAEGTPVRDLIVQGNPNRNAPNWYFTPDQTGLPPTPMAAQYKADTRFQRLDPVRIGIEPTIQATSDQLKFVNQQLASLPEGPRAAALAGLLATTNKTVSAASTQANQINAQNQMQTEIFNIEQAGKEELYGVQNALSFEQRQQTAQAKTEEEMRRWYDRNMAVNINNFQNQQRLNLLDSIFPDVNIDPFGMSVSTAPGTTFNIQDRAAVASLFGFPTQS